MTEHTILWLILQKSLWYLLNNMWDVSALHWMMFLILTEVSTLHLVRVLLYKLRLSLLLWSKRSELHKLTGENTSTTCRESVWLSVCLTVWLSVCLVIKSLGDDFVMGHSRIGGHLGFEIKTTPSIWQFIVTCSPIIGTKL